MHLYDSSSFRIAWKRKSAQLTHFTIDKLREPQEKLLAVSHFRKALKMSQISLDEHESLDEDDEEFIPMEVMPSLRLNDVLKNLFKPTTAVVNLDALIPPKELGFEVLRTLLYRIRPEVKTLSLRYNNFSAESIEYLIDWIAENDHLETLYIMGSGLDEKQRQKLEEAWRKKLTGHRKNNLGYTLIRVTFEKELEAKLAQES